MESERENGKEMVREWGNEKMEREWGNGERGEIAIFSLYFLIFVLRNYS